jgi:hypothetical protein
MNMGIGKFGDGNLALAHEESLSLPWNFDWIVRWTVGDCRVEHVWVRVLVWRYESMTLIIPASVCRLVVFGIQCGKGEPSLNCRQSLSGVHATD